MNILTNIFVKRSEEDMKYKVYASIHYTGRPLRATLKPRLD